MNPGQDVSLMDLIQRGATEKTQVMIEILSDIANVLGVAGIAQFRFELEKTFQMRGQETVKVFHGASAPIRREA
jgi:hypothetical protein